MHELLAGNYLNNLARTLWVVHVMRNPANEVTVRLFNHVVFMINTPESDAHHNLAPQAVARRLNRAGNLFAIGMRALFFAVPLVFWRFGPVFRVVATIGLVFALQRLDRSEPPQGVFNGISGPRS